jgi:BCD family chlorophyll transporter-like MFS transporter
VIFAGPLDSAVLFHLGAAGIGLGGGTFGIATLTAAMTLPSRAASGLALGAWGAAQATAAGLAIFIGGAMRDGVAEAASAGMLGSLGDASLGYSFVYHTEIGLLFLTLVILGPLVRLGNMTQRDPDSGKRHIGLAEFPT